MLASYLRLVAVFLTLETVLALPLAPMAKVGNRFNTSIHESNRNTLRSSESHSIPILLIRAEPGYDKERLSHQDPYTSSSTLTVLSTSSTIVGSSPAPHPTTLVVSKPTSTHRAKPKPKPTIKGEKRREIALEEKRKTSVLEV